MFFLQPGGDRVVKAHGGGRVVSMSGSETSVSSSTPASAIIYDAYTSIICFSFNL